jgi:adenosylcobinamide-GDP ribazoletransferase
MMNIVNAIKSSFGFFTIVPMNDQNFDKESINLLWVPYLAASIFAIMLYVLFSCFLNYYISAILSFIGICLFLGLQNVDALSDLGDGLMKRGSPEVRFKVMKDSANGSGGMFSFFSVYAISLISLLSVNKSEFIPVILFGQMDAVLWMVMISYKSRTTESGYANYFSEVTGKRGFIILNLLPLILILFFLIPQFIIVFSISILMSIIFRFYILGVFKKINGDIIGASGEIGRMFSFIMVNISAITSFPWIYHIYAFIPFH